MEHGIPLTPEEEDIYCRESVNSRALMEYIQTHGREYDLFVFIPLLWGVTYYGSQIWPQKTVLIPCVHDQASFYFSCLRENLPRVKGMIFHSEPERKLAEKLFGVKGEFFQEMGEGVDTSWTFQADRFREKYGLSDPFILYAGRKTRGKNLDLLIACFKQFRKSHTAPLKLVLIGDKKDDSLQEEDILDLGFVSQQDKFDAYGAAEFLCNPSTAESFSLVIMESWIAGRPVLVHADCAVTRYFAESSGGGLSFRTAEEFEQNAERLLRNRKEAAMMGEKGRKYVMDRFRWDRITEKYISYFGKVK